MQTQHQSQNKPFDIRNYEERDTTWESFVEILSSGVKVGVFCTCIYILKEIFMLANDLYFVVESQNLDVITLEIIPFGILFILACFALWIMAKKD